MEKEKSSETSFGAAALRAVHQLIDGEPKIFYDPVILRLLDPGTSAHLLEKRSEFDIPALTRLRSHIVLRSRYAEDCLYEAYHRGIRQYVILGAGLDTFAYRQPAWAHDMRIVEVDHPASQANKLERLRQAGIKLPENLRFVSIDLETESLSSVLNDSVINTSMPVFVSWLGVMVYITRGRAEKVLEFAASLPDSSEFVFTFSQRKRSLWPDLIGKRVAALGEPWITRYHPKELLDILDQLGFSRVSFLDPAEAKRLYYSDRGVALPPPVLSSLVRCVV
jgi:methyltransferase (TIGR00027 family)